MNIRLLPHRQDKLRTRITSAILGASFLVITILSALMGFLPHQASAAALNNTTQQQVANLSIAWVNEAELKVTIGNTTLLFTTPPGEALAHYGPGKTTEEKFTNNQTCAESGIWLYSPPDGGHTEVSGGKVSYIRYQTGGPNSACDQYNFYDHVLKQTANDNIEYTYVGNTIERIDNQSYYSFAPAPSILGQKIYSKSTSGSGSSTCTDAIIVYPLQPNYGTLWELDDPNNPNATVKQGDPAPPILNNHGWNGCYVSAGVDDVAGPPMSNAGVPNARCGLSTVVNPCGNYPMNKDGSFTIHIGGKPGTGGNNGGGGGTTTSSGPQISCHMVFYNPLSWFLCPLADALQTVISGLDDEINNYLDINTQGAKAVYTSGCSYSSNTAQQWCEYHKPWSIIRDIALTLVVLFALLAILSQAFGFEIFDAYSLRKAFPRLIIAIIGITLSWPIMLFLVNLTDVLGIGIRTLIYAPFMNSGFNTIALGGGGQWVAFIFGAGGAFLSGLGFMGLLSFAFTGALAVAIAFLVLIIRHMLIIVLMIFAPIAIVLYVLPHTEKAWKLWWDSFFRGLLMFPIISAIIAIGRVFAAVNTHNTGSFDQVIAFTAYFAPYFFIPFTFRLAGGAIATLGGVVNDRGRGIFDGQKKYRAAKGAQNRSATLAGSRFNKNSRMTRLLGGNVVNRVGSHIGAGARGRFGFGATGAAARSNAAYATMDSAAKENHAFAAQMNNEGAMAALAFGGNEQALRQLAHYRGRRGREQLQQDLAAARTIGINRRNQVAAADALSRSGKVIHNRSEANQLYAEISGGQYVRAGDDYIDDAGRRQTAGADGAISGGNVALRNATRGNYQYNSRQVGRQDIGRNDAHAAFQELDISTLAKQKPLALEELFATRGGTSQFDDALRGAPPLSTERQQMYDVLFAAQYNTSLSPEQQAAIAQTIARHNTTIEWTTAQSNYRSKFRP